jgi:hypothetical protein
MSTRKLTTRKELRQDRGHLSVSGMLFIDLDGENDAAQRPENLTDGTGRCIGCSRSTLDLMSGHSNVDQEGIARGALELLEALLNLQESIPDPDAPGEYITMFSPIIAHLLERGAHESGMNPDETEGIVRAVEAWYWSRGASSKLRPLPPGLQYLTTPGGYRR